MSTPLISVIIPVYNVEKYLRECLDSVINQTLKDIEIICVDDGSTDNSLEILKEYAKKDNRLKIFTQKNKGSGAARNLGIKQSSGEFICFIDSDDYYPSPDILQTLYSSAVQQKVKICGGEFAMFTNETKKLTQNFVGPDTKYLFKQNEIIVYKDYQFDYGYHRFIYNRNMLISNNIFFPDYKRYQDPPFFVKAMLTAEKFYALHKITYAYRQNHKCINWTNERITGLLNGILDNLKTAHEYELSSLKENTYQHLLDHIYQIKKHINKKHISTIKEIQTYFSKRDNLMIEKSLKKTPFYQKLFSIKNSNDKQYKIVHFLGLRIKFKRKKFGGCSFLEHLLSIKNSKDKRYKIIRLCGLRIKIRNNRFVKKLSKKTHKISSKIIHVLTKPIRVQEKYHYLKQEYKRLKNLK
ncbi:MAG: glycosyltransferase family 2 protein [Alphaproteobacteria bacterium]|nr:glycosyltransferase family 2 protein [Alphaproteobacteria bacterium]